MITARVVLFSKSYLPLFTDGQRLWFDSPKKQRELCFTDVAREFLEAILEKTTSSRYATLNKCPIDQPHRVIISQAAGKMDIIAEQFGNEISNFNSWGDFSMSTNPTQSSKALLHLNTGERSTESNHFFSSYSISRYAMRAYRADHRSPLQAACNHTSNDRIIGTLISKVTWKKGFDHRGASTWYWQHSSIQILMGVYIYIIKDVQ